MVDHLSDLACAEWSRSGTTQFAPEAPFRVEAHLMGCRACSDRVVAFRDLDRDREPFGAPFGLPRAVIAWRVFCIATALATLALVIVLAVRARA